jgi:hypothetical protein
MQSGEKYLEYISSDFVSLNVEIKQLMLGKASVKFKFYNKLLRSNIYEYCEH